MSTLKVDGIRSNSASSDAITLASDGTCTANITNRSNRNLIINGAMNIAQRGTSSTSNGYTTVDRISCSHYGTNESPTRSQSDVASGTTPYNLGFRKAFKLTNGNQTATDAGDHIQIDYFIESQDLSKSGWNYTSSSSYVTLSFWIKSSVGIAYPFTWRAPNGSAQVYNMSTGTLSANTWTKVTKTIPGNSNITINNDGNSGARLMFFPYVGTTYTTNGLALDTWSAWANAKHGFEMATTWWTTDDATFEITGLQLEVGSVATDFEHRSIGQELALCHRYCYVWESSVAYSNLGTGVQTDSSNVDLVIPLPQIMRASPSFSSSGSFRTVGYDSGSQTAKGLSSFSMTRSHPHTPYLRGGISGGTGGAVGELGDNGSNDAKAFFSAEL